MKIRLTIGLIRQILDETDQDLLSANKETVIQCVWGDITLSGRIIGIVSGREDIKGQELASYQDALADALLNFFPKPSIYDQFIDETERKKAEAVDPWRVVFKAAGCAGVEPWDYSARELIWMAEGAYEPIAALIADAKNSRLKEGKKPIDVETLNRWNPKRPYVKS
ncbi:MAG: hypothetical protein AAGC72_01130 [Planctomycetota bacterium]